MGVWSNRRAESHQEVRNLTHKVKVDNQNGKHVKATIEAKGQAITNKADFDEAAKNERKR